MAPKRQGMVPGYRSIKRQAAKREAQFWGFISTFDECDEVIEKVPTQKMVTFGVDISQLDAWLEKDLTGQEGLPGPD